MENRDMLKDNIKNEAEAVDTASALSTETIENNEDEGINLVVKLKKPYTFEGKEYTEIDLSGLNSLTTNDLISVDRYLKDRGASSFEIMQEVSMEYACIIAARACKLPTEFFMGLPAKYALRVKNRIVAFFLMSD